MPRPTRRVLCSLGVRLDAWMEEQKANDRFGRGVSQTDIASALGIGTSAVSEWMYGDTVPSMNNLHALADLTGIPFVELVGYVEQVVSRRRGQSTGRKARAAQDVDATAPDPEGPEGGA